MRINRFAAACSIVCLLTGSRSGAAQDRSIASVIDTLDRVRGFHETAISPDGQRIAWVQDVAGGGTAVFWRDLRMSNPAMRVTAAIDPAANTPHNEGDVAWSPDGQSLIFLSDAITPGQLQVCRYLAPTGAYVSTGVNPGCFTHVSGQLAHPRWSPDGTRVAFLFVSGSTQGTGALVAYKPDSGVVGETVEEQRIAIVDLSDTSRAPTVREVSPANLFVYDYDWSPDGNAFAAEAVDGSGTNNYWIAQLYTIKADTGAATSIWKPPLQLAWPRWSPDGKSIAVIHGIMSDEGRTAATSTSFLRPAARRRTSLQASRGRRAR